MREIDWRFMNACLGPSASSGCAICGETEFSPDVEAFEETGKLLCFECFDVLDDQALSDLDDDE